jgi:hypothetical protein
MGFRYAKAKRPGTRRANPTKAHTHADTLAAVNYDDPAPKAEQFGDGLVPQKNRFHKRGHGGPSIRKTFSIMSPQRKNRPMRAHRTPEG